MPRSIQPFHGAVTKIIFQARLGIQGLQTKPLLDTPEEQPE
jgi:hypothetical protein